MIISISFRHIRDWMFLFKTFNFRSASAKLGVSVFNLTNRINVKYKQFVHELNVPNMPNAVAIFEMTLLSWAGHGMSVFNAI